MTEQDELATAPGIVSSVGSGAALEGARTSVLGLDPAAYSRHRLHGPDVHWPENNCSLDMWIEVLHSLQLEPVAAGSFVFAGDFIEDQWLFLKFPEEDIRELFGVEVHEINVWRSLHDQIAELLSHGKLVTVEVDAFYLPDLAGTSYKQFHTKTSITVDRMDLAAREVDYFHASGYYRATGEDFDGLLAWQQYTTVMAPFAEVILLDRLRRDDVRPAAREQLRRHLARRPDTNPVERMGLRVTADLPWVKQLGLEGYHLYAFGGLRQCGASAQIASLFLQWLDDPELLPAAESFESVAVLAKSIQFSLARIARGRTVDVSGTFAEMADAWETGISLLVQKLG